MQQMAMLNSIETYLEEDVFFVLEDNKDLTERLGRNHLPLLECSLQSI